MTAPVAEIKMIGTEYVVMYHGEIISRQKNVLKATQKLMKYVKGLQ